MVISLYSEAKFIYKMDEDVYITDHCIEKMEKVYMETEKNRVPYRICRPDDSVSYEW